MDKPLQCLCRTVLIPLQQGTSAQDEVFPCKNSQHARCGHVLSSQG